MAHSIMAPIAQLHGATQIHGLLQGGILCYGITNGLSARSNEGLPAIFEASADFEWDIRADSRILYQRWVVGQLDPHLLRGIEDKKNY